MNIDRSRFDSTFTALFVSASQGYARVTARNSVFASANPGAFQQASPAAPGFLFGGDDPGEDAELIAIGSTFYGTGSYLHAGLYAYRPSDRPGNIDVKLINTVVRLAGADGVKTADISVNTGTTNPLAGAVTVSADHSAFSSVLATGLATAPAPGAATNVSGDPLFAATPAGTLDGVDLSLLDGSPLVDRGETAQTTAGELDYAGAARSLDGDGSCAAAPDIGAFERAAKACVPTATPSPTPTPTPTPTATATPDRVKPLISKLKLATHQDDVHDQRARDRDRHDRARSDRPPEGQPLRRQAPHREALHPVGARAPHDQGRRRGLAQPLGRATAPRAPPRPRDRSRRSRQRERDGAREPDRAELARRAFTHGVAQYRMIFTTLRAPPPQNSPSRGGTYLGTRFALRYDVSSVERCGDPKSARVCTQLVTRDRAASSIASP